MIIRFWRTFVTKDVDIIGFSDKSKIQAMLSCIKTPRAKELVGCALKFQSKAQGEAYKKN